MSSLQPALTLKAYRRMSSRKNDHVLLYLCQLTRGINLKDQPLSNQVLLQLSQWLENTPKLTYTWHICAWVQSCILHHTSTHAKWLRSFIKSIFLCSNHLPAITSIGLMTLIRFNCIHLAVRGECCSHSSPHRWQHSMLRDHECLCEWVCTFAEREGKSVQSIKCVVGEVQLIYAFLLQYVSVLQSVHRKIR